MCDKEERRRAEKGRRDSLSLFFAFTREKARIGRKERERNGERREISGAEISVHEGEEEDEANDEGGRGGRDKRGKKKVRQK